MQLGIVQIVMLDAVDGRVLQIMEELIKLMLDSSHHACALVSLDIVRIAIAIMRVMCHVVHITGLCVMMVEIEIAAIGVLRTVLVHIMVLIVSLAIDKPVIWTMLDTMSVMVLIHVLWVVLTIITV